MAIYNGTQKIKVSGVGKIYVGTQLVYQEAVVLTSITLSGQTTSLNRGSAFSFGGTVTAHYSDGSTANVTSSTTFSGYNMNTAGTYTVTASYTENGITVTATYSLTVNKIWTTIFSGTKTISYDPNGTKPDNVDVVSVNVTGNQTFRVSWTYSVNTAGSVTQFYKDGTNVGTTAPASPTTLAGFNTSNSITNRIAVRRIYSTSNVIGKYAALNWDATNKKFYLFANSLGSSNYAPYKASLTITKIERYY